MTEDQFIALARAKYAELHSLEQSPNLLDYERSLSNVMREFTRQVMEAQLSGSSKDRRKKKVL